MSTAKNFLIQELWNLGDLIHVEPLASGLRSLFPNCRIVWLVSPRCKELVKKMMAPTDLYFELNAPWTNATKKYSLERYRGIGNEIRELKKQFRSLHIEAGFDIRGDARTNALLRIWKLKAAFAFFPESRLMWTADSVSSLVLGRKIHLIEKASEPMARYARGHRLGAAYQPSFPLLRPHLNVAMANSKPSGIKILWHPGAQYSNRACPPQVIFRTLALAKKMYPDWEWTVVATKTDTQRWSPTEIEGLQTQGNLRLTNLDELLGLMSEANVVIAGDSAPLHLSSALNRPTLGIFAYDTAEEWGPFSDRSAILHPKSGVLPAHLRYKNHLESGENSPLAGVSEDAILKAIQSLI